MRTSLHIGEVRKAKGFSRIELARLAGIAVSTMYDIEDGLVSDVRLSTLLKLANALRVTPDYLLGIERAKASCSVKAA